MNICRLTWEVSIKLNRERKRKLKEKLNSLPPNDVLKLTKDDLKLMLKKEYEDSLANMIDTISLDNETPYEHMLIESSEVYNEEENEENKQSLSLLENDMIIIDNKDENSSIYVDMNSNYIDDKIKQDETDISMFLKNDSHNIQNICDWNDDWSGADDDEKEEDEHQESCENDEDFDIQLLKKYYNRKS
ncbi:hypothetical protein [Plasmodium yoelii yoelii]|nr:hypothetical protein [Plasmodium yoelii yoelii]